MRRFWVVLLLLAVLAVTIWRARGPAPRPETASGFSAVRANAVLRELLAEGVPHPVGTAANARVRERIVARFRSLGYVTDVQRRFACNALPACATVENIIARAPGQRGRAVVLLAHYDSVGAGAGASDDGTGVATLLEVARVVRNDRSGNPIMFLVTDGEEAGLLGAEAFVADEPLARDAGIIINVENRGTYGPSSMFETSRGNRWLIRRLSRALQRPQATSFFYAIYSLLPNDTDVTVFKRSGVAAVNFAAIGGVNWYHTSLDDLGHVNLRTLQHHGDNALASARAFAGADLDARSKDDASYFDILGFTMIWWPAGATIWIAVVSLVLLMIGVRKTEARAMTFGVLATFTAIVLAIVGGLAVGWLARLRSGGINWVANPLPSVAAMWLIGTAAALCAAALFARRGGQAIVPVGQAGSPVPHERALLYGAAIVWHAIAIALALTLTGASFVFLVPAVAVTICALARANETVTSAVASAVAAILIFPMGIMLYDALGGRLMAAIAILIGVTMTLTAPLFARLRYAAAAAALAIVCALIALALPSYTRERPRPISLSYVDDATATPTWATWTVTPELARAAKFAPASITPWNRGQLGAPAPAVAMPRVEVSGARSGRIVTLRVRSPRGAERMTLAYRGGMILRVNGVTPPLRTARFRERVVDGWHFASVHGVEEATFEIRARGALEVIASDSSHGLPASGAALLRARDASVAVPVHEGDVTVTRVRLKM